MFRFADPSYLYLLFLLPVLVGIYFYALWCDRRNRHRLGDAELLYRMSPESSKRRKHFKFILILLGVASLSIMLARPQYGTTTSSENRKGIEAVFLFDVSNSMLAQDVQPNRLERSKLLVSNIIERMSNDKVALSVFAGEAYPQLPITEDYTSAYLFLDSFEPGMVTLQGTNIAAAIELGLSSFTEKKDIGKAIVIITDGEDHEGGALEAAKKARKAGVRVYILGVGSPEGSKIPLPNGGYLTDENGEVVVTGLNEQMCKNAAEEGGGKYFHIDNSDAAQRNLAAELGELKKADTSTSFEEPDEQFRAFALIALLLLLLELFVREIKNPLFERLRLFKK